MSLNLTNKQHEDLEKEQKQMEKVLKQVISVTKSPQGSGIIEMMHPNYIGCSYKEKELSVMFHVEKWELNPQGSMHGGLICAAFDNTFGMLTHYLADDNFITTVDLSTRYLKPVPVDSDLLIKAKARSVGGTLVSLTGEAYLEGKNILAATSSSTFMILKNKKTKINSAFKE